MTQLNVDTGYTRSIRRMKLPNGAPLGGWEFWDGHGDPGCRSHLPPTLLPIVGIIITYSTVNSNGRWAPMNVHAQAALDAALANPPVRHRYVLEASPERASPHFKEYFPSSLPSHPSFSLLLSLLAATEMRATLSTLLWPA